MVAIASHINFHHFTTSIAREIKKGCPENHSAQADPNRLLKNKNQVVRQGARRFGKRNIFQHM